MSKTSKIVIMVVVIVVAVILLYFSLSSQPSTGLAPTQQGIAKNNNQASGESAGNVPVVNPQDTSDTAINNDLSNIDNQMQGLNTDSNNINQSLTN